MYKPKLPQTIWKPLYGDIARTLFTVIAITGVLILFINQQRNNTTQLQQLTNITKQQKTTIDNLAANSKQSTMQIQDLQKHIDCIVELFQQPNRANLILGDLTNCQINSAGQVSTSTSPKVTGVASPQPQPNFIVQPVIQPSLSSPPSQSSSPAQSSSPPIPAPPG